MMLSDKTLDQIWALLIEAAPVPATLAGALIQTIDDADDDLTDAEIAQALAIVAAFFLTSDDKATAYANLKRAAEGLEKLVTQMYEISDEAKRVYDA